MNTKIELNFSEWMVEEGIFDTVKQYGRKAAMGAALMGAGAVGANMYNRSADNSQIPSSSATSPDAGSYLNRGSTKVQVKPAQTKFQQAFGGIKRDNLRMKQKRDQVLQSGQNQATFDHGELELEQ